MIPDAATRCQLLPDINTNTKTNTNASTNANTDTPKAKWEAGREVLCSDGGTTSEAQGFSVADDEDTGDDTLASR